MTPFGEPIPPSETVEWQWPKPFGLKQALAMLPYYAVGMLAGWAYWTDALAGNFWPNAALAFAIAVLPSLSGKLLRFAGVLLWGRRWIIVTRWRIVLTTGRFLPRFRTVYRDTIRSAALYEGDGTLVLHGRDGDELLRFAWWDDDRLATLLALLDVPTAVWPRRKPGEAVRAIRRRALTASLILWTVLSGGAITLAGLGGIAAAADWVFRSMMDVITLPGTVAVSVAGGGAAIFLGIMIQIFLLDLFSFALADKDTPQDVINELICYSNDPLWSGLPRELAAPGRLPDAMQFANDLAKGFGLPPAELVPLEPERPDFRAQQDPEAAQ